MPAKKKKRKYTFRKGQIIPYESGSLMHEMVKAEREARKIIRKVLEEPKEKKRKKEGSNLT